MTQTQAPWGWTYEDYARLPDDGKMLFIPKRALPGLRERGAESAPDLVVEVVSPSSRSVERGKKARRYRDFGVPEFWVVDPVANTVEVYRPKLEEPEVHADRIRWQPDRDTPALEIDLADLFRPLIGQTAGD